MNEEIKKTEIAPIDISLREGIINQFKKDMPTRPSAQGLGEEEIRSRLCWPAVGQDDEAPSVLNELGRVIDEANAAFATKTTVKKDGEIQNEFSIDNVVEFDTEDNDDNRYIITKGGADKTVEGRRYSDTPLAGVSEIAQRTSAGVLRANTPTDNAADKKDTDLINRGYFNSVIEQVNEKIGDLTGLPDELNTLKEVAEKVDKPFKSDKKDNAVSVGVNGELVANEELVTKAYVKEEAAKAQGTVYANALKGVASGTVVRLDDVSPLTHNMGVKVSGKNLIPFPYYSLPTGTGEKEINGVKFAVNDDGTVTVSGQLKEESTYATFYLSTGLPKIAHGKKCVLTGCPSGGSNDTYYLRAQFHPLNGTMVQLNNAGKVDPNFSVAVVPKNTTSESIFITVATHEELTTPITFKPQIEFGETATQYEPYLVPSNVNLRRLGSNLLYSSTVEELKINSASTGEEVKRYGYKLQLPAGKYYVKAKTLNDSVYIYTAVVSKEGTRKDDAYNGKTSSGIDSTSYIIAGTTNYTLNENNPANWDIYDGDVIYIYDASWNNAATDTENKRNAETRLGSTTIQIELVPVTKYEDVVFSQYSVNTDGTVEGVTSVAPTTTLMTDNPNVTIEVEYNKDINTVLDNAAALPTVDVGDAGKFLVVDTLGNIVTTTIETGGGY